MAASPVNQASSHRASGRASPLSGLHDVELAALAAAGDRGAFGELARRHGAGVRALLRRMGADSSLADDLAQDAFLAAYEHIAEFRGEGPFVGWLKRIAARLYVRRWRRRVQLDPMEAREADAPLDGPSTDEGDAIARLDLDEALRLLSPSERVCVSLCFGAGMSHAEAADALKAPLGTVKSHTRRGLDKLRKRLASAHPSAISGATDSNGEARSA
jgi:RNA polymerase sigma-70 factor (ECF subfamily)